MSFASRDLVKKLIQAYENSPTLYDVQSADYKHKTKRNECITHIVKELEPYGIFSQEDIKKKWSKDTILQRIKQAEEKPNKRCRNSAPVRRGESNLMSLTQPSTSEIIDTDEGELIYDGPSEELQNIDFEDILSTNSDIRPSTSSTIEAPERAHRKRKRSEQSAQDILAKATATLEQVGQDNEDHLDVFGQFIASELRKIKNVNAVNKLKRSIVNQIYDVIEKDL